MITLVGVSHFDVNGYDRLNKILNRLKPSAIGIEETKKDFEKASNLIRSLSDSQIFEYALKKAQKQFPDANPNTLRLWLSSSNYEIRSIREYSASNNIRIICCDNPEELAKVDFEGEFNKPKISLNQIVEGFLRLPPEEARLNISREYSFSEYPVKDSTELVKFYQARDQFTEQILLAQGGNVVYVCGLDHVFGDYHPNLLDRLSDINPQRMKLSEADKL